MKYLLILFLLLFSCGKETIVSNSSEPYLPPDEPKELFIKVEYSVYLEGLEYPECTGYDTTASFKDENEQNQTITIHLHSGEWIFVFYHLKELPQIFAIEADRQGNFVCGPLRVELWINDVLVDFQSGTYLNQILEVYYEYSEEVL